MPTTIGEPFSHNILTDPTAPEPSILPIHVAQYRQNVEHQRRREQQAQGVELEDFPPQGHHQQAPHRHSTEPEDSHTPSARSSSDSILEDDPLLDEIAPSSSQMKRARRYKNKSPARLDLNTTASQNGHANGNANGSANGTIHVDTANGDMNNRIEFRRKRPSIDSPDAAAITAHLMGRESFSLDNEPPQTPQTPGLANNSFWDLPAQDRRNFLLLVLLYFLQGIPMGLAGGSVPFLLKKYLSYGQIGVFSLASYPYSLKLLWSPIVDAVWSPKVGRRKSWILPIQTISGLGMIYLGGRVDSMMKEAGANDGAGVWNFMSWWFLLVFMCATQDIAVDGWALTLLSPQNIAYASTAQTVGLTAGSFLSHTVFLAFNAPDFANRWFRTIPKDVGIMTLGGYLEFWGWAYLLVTLAFALLKREEKTKERDGIMEVYRSMIGILKLKSIQKIIVVHLISKLGFQANDGVTALKLLDKGFGQENMALVVLIDFPFEISLGYYAGKWSTKYTPMRLWCWAFVGRLIAAVVAQFVVMIYPKNGVTTWYLLVIITTNIFSTFMNTIMFVAVSAFHARVADPAIGGTYMTLLAT
jgi:MFS transporter, PAT family, solute carrier family 33 (acetyl-CoA transportor), member 1